MGVATADPSLELRYPIGRYQPPPQITEEQRSVWIQTLADLPSEFERLLKNRTPRELEKQYRPGGWTVRQIVHHMADSHMNSYVRFRLALTEDSPRTKPYDEGAWAELPDARSGPIEESLAILRGLHSRWCLLLRSLTTEQFARTLDHPELGRIRIDWMLGLYAWHSLHHAAHITRALATPD